MKDRILEEAIALAKKSPMTQKHGAIIFSGDGRHILGKGYNQHAAYMSHGWSCHAEKAALLSIRNKGVLRKDVALVVVRIDANDTVKMSEPCEHCKKEITKSGIRRVFYSYS